MMEYMRKRLDEVNVEIVAFEMNVNLDLEEAKAENANVLAEQEAQQMANDKIIANLTNHLQRVKNEVATLDRQESVLRMHSTGEQVRRVYVVENTCE